MPQRKHPINKAHRGRGAPWEFCLAYRFLSGKQEVEGFKGLGGSADAAEQDCVLQIGRKLRIIREHSTARDREQEEYDPSRLIRDLHDLSLTEIAQVHRDWETSVRY